MRISRGFNLAHRWISEDLTIFKWATNTILIIHIDIVAMAGHMHSILVGHQSAPDAPLPARWRLYHPSLSLTHLYHCHLSRRHHRLGSRHSKNPRLATMSCSLVSSIWLYWRCVDTTRPRLNSQSLATSGPNINLSKRTLPTAGERVDVARRTVRLLIREGPELRRHPWLGSACLPLQDRPVCAKWKPYTAACRRCRRGFPGAEATAVASLKPAVGSNLSLKSVKPSRCGWCETGADWRARCCDAKQSFNGRQQGQSRSHGT